MRTCLTIPITTRASRRRAAAVRHFTVRVFFVVVSVVFSAPNAESDRPTDPSLDRQLACENASSRTRPCCRTVLTQSGVAITNDVHLVITNGSMRVDCVCDAMGGRWERAGQFVER